MIKEFFFPKVIWQGLQFISVDITPSVNKQVSKGERPQFDAEVRGNKYTVDGRTPLSGGRKCC